MCKESNINSEIDLSFVDEIVESIGKEKRYVIPVLQALQNQYNYLPQEALNRICETTEITAADIHGIATFYSQFRMKPAGKHSIKVCVGTACHVMGAEKIYDAFKSYLEIPEDDDTDADRLFTVEKVACLGCCMLAPAVQIDEMTYGFLTPGTVGNAIDAFLSQSIEDSNTQDRKESLSQSKGEVNICQCSSCVASGSRKILDQLYSNKIKYQLSFVIHHVGCTGKAFEAPYLTVLDSNEKIHHYTHVQPDAVQTILLKHFHPDSIFHKLYAGVDSTLDRIYSRGLQGQIIESEMPPRNIINHHWHRDHIVTASGGQFDPLDLETYEKNGGFEAVKKCLYEKSSSDVIQLLKESKLRGRGGGGFPAWKKWQAVFTADAQDKRIICNGDEGDPGAFMDRMILESFPFQVIEGILIASIVLNANRSVIYVRAEYPVAIERLKKASRMLKQRGFLGDRVLNTDHAFHLDIVAGAGAFVCGEETALIAAVEGRRGTPRLRPPYPAQTGLEGLPTLVNNVETFSLIPWIVRNGAEAFQKIGTEHSKGTKTFALAGKINRSGLVEVPMGITLCEIVEDIGGGIPGRKAFKAIQVGGPSGGCIPAHLADLPVDYEALLSEGAMMGSGGMVVLDETDCMVEIARYFMSFTQAESCGKCTFCRIGTRRMLDILERLVRGEGRKGDIELLESLAKQVQSGSLCGLGRSAPNPVLSTIKHFREEYEAHIEGHCPAHQCKSLIQYSITDQCIGCTRCAQRCPAGAIKIRPYEKHEIDQEKCIQCGGCKEACQVEAVEVS